MQKIVRPRDIKSVTGLSRSQIYRLVAASKFPKPVPLGEKAVGWTESQINEWLAGRMGQAA